LLRQVATIRRDVLGAVHRHTIDAQLELSAALIALERFEEAEDVLHTSQDALAQQAAAEGSDDLRRVRSHLETLYRAWDRPQRAAAFADATS
jgi:aminopeptidase N